MRHALSFAPARYQESFEGLTALQAPNLQIVAKFVARALTGKDTPALKELRLKALREERNYFRPAYETEVDFRDDQWRTLCTPKEDHCYFGLFDNGRLIGMMLATKWEGDDTGQTALWGSAYIHPEYRSNNPLSPYYGRKLGRLMYEVREKWTREHPRFKRSVFYIRERNQRCREIHENKGAEHVYTEPLRPHHKNNPAGPWYWYERRFGQVAAHQKPLSNYIVRTLGCV
jgi:hypothetical protein